MASLPQSAQEQQQEVALPRAWYRSLSRMLAHHRRAEALAFLERSIAESLPLLNRDHGLFDARRSAWLIRTHMLLEWDRPAEALAWTCLECHLFESTGRSPDARALRDRLIRQMSRSPATVPAHAIAVEARWPGVAGMFDLRAHVERDLIAPLRFPEDAARYGIAAPNGILLYGPPDCGKSFMARKIAEKLGYAFVANGHDTAAGIAQLCEHAEASAPSVVFFDALDTLGAEPLRELLTRLERAAPRRLLVVAATDYPDRLDRALLRPGRLNPHFYADLPDLAARAALFKHHLGKRPYGRILFEELAAKSEGYTSAEIARLCDHSARHALGESAKVDRDVFISWTHFDVAMRFHPPAVIVERHTRLGLDRPRCR